MFINIKIVFIAKKPSEPSVKFVMFKISSNYYTRIDIFMEKTIF